MNIGFHIALLAVRHAKERSLEANMSGASKSSRICAVQECATGDDFQAIFTERMAGLYMLAFMLTADQAKAEKCFVAGLEDSLQANPVFRQWAHAWARRTIIKNAVRLMTMEFEKDNSPFDLVMRAPYSDQEILIDAVIKLPAFERFVFVVSVLEGHSLSDTATLLDCTNSQLSRAHVRAIEHVARLLNDAISLKASSADQPRWCADLGFA